MPSFFVQSAAIEATYNQERLRTPSPSALGASEAASCPSLSVLPVLPVLSVLPFLSVSKILVYGTGNLLRLHSFADIAARSGYPTRSRPVLVQLSRNNAM